MRNDILAQIQQYEARIAGASDAKLKAIEALHQKLGTSKYILSNFSETALVEMHEGSDEGIWHFVDLESIDKGLTLRIADEAARFLGMTDFLRKPSRLAAVGLSVIKNVASMGDTFCAESWFKTLVMEYNLDEIDAKLILKNLVAKNRVYLSRDGKRVFFTDLTTAEKRFAQMLVATEKRGGKLERFCDISQIETLDDEQLSAVEAVFDHPVVLLTGLPGTGKTRTISVIAKLFSNSLLMAPTGKAARRMTELAEIEATTVHSLVGCYSMNGDMVVNALLIIDEVSMLDVEIAGKLAEVVDVETCRILLVGDPNQLPSVGPGQIIQDLLAANKLKHVHLKKIKRQKPGSVVLSAHAVVQGKDIVVGEDRKVLVHEYVNLEETVKKIAKSEAWSGAQFLTVLKERGSDIINPIIQNVVNPGGQKYRVGDKVMHLKNMKDLGVMNGEMGVVRETLPTGVFFCDYGSHARRVRYTPRMGWAVSLGYAFTVHKAQGSEFEKVVFVLNDARILDRNLFYTALTRASDRILILTPRKDLVQEAIDRLPRKRNTLTKVYVERLWKEE